MSTNRLRLVLLSCMLMAAWALFAQQGSMRDRAQTPQMPGAASQNPQAQGPQSPAQSQNPAQSPEAQTPQGQPSQAPMHSVGSGADAQVNALTQALNLNSDQQTRIKAILEDQHQQGETVVNDPSLSHDAKLQKVHALRQATIEKVRATLTTDDQKSKFDTMIQASNERIRQREQQEQQQPQPK